MASSSSWLVVVSGAVVCMAALVPASHAARAFFVFGDSLVDNGNNNYLITTARADAPPYGIDFPTHQATGRFSNGLNIPDIISEHLGAEPALPYLSPQLRGEKLLVGANFASAGVGILNDTGVQFVNIIRIGDQLQYFREYQRKLRALVGEEQAKRLVNGALVLITLGGNDFVNNYYLVPMSVRSRQFAIQDYVPFIISEYKKILAFMAELPAACHRTTVKSIGRCHEVGGDVFVGINTKRAHDDFIEDPQAHGFATSTEACCGQGRFNGMGLCTVVSNLCADRDAYVFWDAFHPTERANRLIVQQFMDGSPDVITPMNLSTILKLDQQPLN
uniref:Uncharacterized protein n=1 Tax=Oryza brachyantha TaxID=4533 RepID=J3LIC4_ORYBR